MWKEADVASGGNVGNHVPANLQTRYLPDANQKRRYPSQLPPYGCFEDFHVVTASHHALRAKLIHSRAIAEAVSRWLPTAAARVQSRVWSSGICGGQSGAGAGFLQVLRFPLPFIPPNSPSSLPPGPGTIGQ
jgi:hypothetical protein